MAIYDKNVKSYYNKKKEDLTCMTRVDLPYFRKRITQLEQGLLARDIRYQRFKKKYRTLQYRYKKILQWIGIKYDNLPSEVFNLPANMHLDDITREIKKTWGEERDYCRPAKEQKMRG